MVLAVEMGVVFVLLTAILIALYVAWQNAKFVGDRLRKKQVMKRLVASGAAIILAVVVAISTMVPAFAAEVVNATPENSQQIAYEEPEFLNEERGDNYIILPDAPQKDGYIFTGWRVNGSKTTYSSGKEVSVKTGEKVTLTPVYCSNFLHVCAVMAHICFAIFFTLFVLRAFGDFSDKAKVVLNILIVVSVMASSFFITAATTNL